jgi:hypothetical protein
MPDNLFGVSFSTYPSPQQVITDTVIPIPPVPVYVIHSFEQPFCQEGACSCHAHRQEVVRWFVKIVEGQVALEPAAHLLDALNAERK